MITDSADSVLPLSVLMEVGVLEHSPGMFTWCGRICHTNTRRIYWRKWRLEMFSLVSEFSFVRSLYSALYHEHYIGNSEWVYRERFRTQLKTARMTSENTRITVEDAPATFKWFVWQHFGYPAEIMNGSRVTDKTRTIPSCRWHTWSDCLHYLHSVLTK